MAVTLQIKGDASSSITLSCKTISKDTTSSKMKVSSGSGQPYYIKFGYERSFTITGMVFSSADYAKIAAWTGDVILDCTASTYPEISVSSATGVGTNYLIVDKAKIDRKGGYLDMWNYSFTMIQGDLDKLKRWT